MTFYEAKELVSRMRFGPTFQFTLEQDPYSHLVVFTVHEWVLDAVSAPFTTRGNHIRIPPSAWRRESYHWGFEVRELAGLEDDFFKRCEDVFIKMRIEKVRLKFALDPKPEPHFVEYFVDEAVL